MAVLLDKEKRNYSAETSNRCLNSHPDYQGFDAWLVGTMSGLGTPGAAESLGIHQPHRTRIHHICFHPLLGIFRDIGGGSGEKGRGWVMMLRIWVKAALSSIDDQHSKSQPALKWVGVRDQGHLHTLKLTPILPHWREGLQNHWGMQISLQEESLGVPFSAF